MKKIVFALSVLSFLGISYSARGEHAVDSQGRPVFQVPAISAGERINELINACSVGRPFPALRYRQLPPPAQIDQGGLITPPGPGDVGQPPAGPVADSSAPPQSSVTPPSSGSGAGNGQAIYANRCAKCHDSGPGPNIKGNAAGVATRTADGSMPPGGPSLSPEEQSALVNFMASGG